MFCHIYHVLENALKQSYISLNLFYKVANSHDLIGAV